MDNKPDAPDLPPAEIFKAYDIRGIVGKTLTAKHAQLIGQALGTEAIKRGLDKIVFARDGRLSGPELGQALVQGIVRTGVSVVDVGMVPTPLLYFAAAELTNGTGVMLTGSHNPPEYNGFKMVLGGETLASEAIQDLRRRIENSDFARGKGSYEKTRIPEKYVKRIIGDVKLKRKLRIVIDCGNGVAGKIAPALYRAMGCDVTELYCDVDGNFPNHHPDPSKPENMKDLIQMVTSKRFDVGFAFDGDGDRLGVVSPNGSIIWPDRLMMLFAEDVISRNNGAQIIYDIKCSSNLTRVIWEKGGEPLMWKTGHSLIKAKMKQSGALLAGEMSGHIFFKERWYGFDDGLYSGARLLEILSKDTRTPQQVFDSLPDAFNTPELNVKMEEGEHHRFIDSFMGQADFGDANVTMIDGIRVDYDDAWGLIRASNTTPVLVLRFEGNSQEAMQRVQNEFRRQILDLNPNLNLPF
ncbi:MAG: phosphomannomutase/phosphoglucomutase [Gammaproteobacteria bacterium]|nr:phosphomannomutase/phosphoglucomutase [Gammaproteobacteria bacterium]